MTPAINHHSITTIMVLPSTSTAHISNKTRQRSILGCGEGAVPVFLSGVVSAACCSAVRRPPASKKPRLKALPMQKRRKHPGPICSDQPHSGTRVSNVLSEDSSGDLTCDKNRVIWSRCGMSVRFSKSEPRIVCDSKLSLASYCSSGFSVSDQRHDPV